MLSYGRITFHFRIRVFTRTRRLFSCCSVFRPDARGYMLFYRLADRIKQHVQYAKRMFPLFRAIVKLPIAKIAHLSTNLKKIIGQIRVGYQFELLSSSLTFRAQIVPHQWYRHMKNIEILNFAFNFGCNVRSMKNEGLSTRIANNP